MLQDSVWEEQSNLITYIDSSRDIYLWVWADPWCRDAALESHARRRLLGRRVVMEDAVSGSCLRIVPSCKGIQQLAGPGEEPVSVNTAHLGD